MCTFGNFLAPVLVAAHTVNNLGLANGQGSENEGYEVIKKLRPFCRLKGVSYVTSPKGWLNKIK